MYSVIFAPSSWKIPVVSPLANRSNAFLRFAFCSSFSGTTSSGIFSSTTSSSRACLIYLSALSRMVRLESPKKSNLIKPNSSRCACSYCVMRPFLGSLGSRSCSGTKCSSPSLATITPAAWIPVERTDPSNFKAWSMISCATRFSLYRSFNSLTASSDLWSVTCGPVGMRRVIRSPISCSPMTRATSLIEALAAIVLNVTICATQSSPYLRVTYSITSSRRSSGKSMSISGMSARSVLKKRSKGSW